MPDNMEVIVDPNVATAPRLNDVFREYTLVRRNAHAASNPRTGSLSICQ
jgi:hypothetical protein